jgi:2-aminoethylphosphonate-pyruvate transaminase
MKTAAELFDFIGTTVLEKREVINRSFEKAFGDNGVLFNHAVLNKYRGRDKHEIIEMILADDSTDITQKRPSLALEIVESFHANIVDSLSEFVLNDGVNEVLRYLRMRKIKVGVGSALNRSLFDKIFSHVQFDETMFDYIGIANEAGRSRPHPDMIFDMMKKLDIQNPTSFIKVGDTITDILEGKNAGVVTVAVLSGTQSMAVLKNAQPDFLLENLRELIQLVK